MFKPGDIVFEHYEILRPFQAGPTGGVYLVRHNDFPDRKLVLKALRLTQENVDDLTAARFRNEILATYEVQHPNIIRTFGYLRDDTLIGFTMEFLDQGNLRTLLKSEQQIPLTQALIILREILQGLCAIHDVGIIHRDVRPENILFGKSGEVKICDFGVARFGGTVSSGMGIAGNLEYLSPEYIKDGSLSPASDIYSVGILAYELLSRRRPFQASSPIRALAQRLTEQVVPPHVVNPQCPIPVSDIVVRALQPQPEHRFAGAREMLTALEASFTGLPNATQAIQPIVAAREETAPEPPSVTKPTPQMEKYSLAPSAVDSSNTIPESERHLVQDVFQYETPATPSRERAFKLPVSLRSAALFAVLGAGSVLLLPYAFPKRAQSKSPAAATQTAIQTKEQAVSQPQAPAVGKRQATIPRGWYVQYLKSKDMYTAGIAAERLSKQGFYPEVQTAIEQGGEIAFYVLLGPFPNENAARSALGVLVTRQLARPDLNIRFFDSA